MASWSWRRHRWRRARSVAQSVSSKDRRAAAMARSMSAAVASAVWPSTSSVAGLMLSKAPPPVASTSEPSMSMRNSPTVESGALVVVMCGSFRSLAPAALAHCGGGGLVEARARHPRKRGATCSGPSMARSGPDRLHGVRGWATTWGDAYRLHPRRRHPRALGPGRVNLALTDAERRFRDDVRSWLEANVEPGPEFGSFDEEFEWGRRWQARLAADRWVGIHWPAEFGGPGGLARRSGHLQRGVRPRPGAPTRQPHRGQPGRPDPPRPRRRRSSGAAGCRAS